MAFWYLSNYRLAINDGRRLRLSVYHNVPLGRISEALWAAADRVGNDCSDEQHHGDDDVERSGCSSESQKLSLNNAGIGTGPVVEETETKGTVIHSICANNVIVLIIIKHT